MSKSLRDASTEQIRLKRDVTANSFPHVPNARRHILHQEWSPSEESQQWQFAASATRE